jgi:hypothetical protein
MSAARVRIQRGDGALIRSLFFSGALSFDLNCGLNTPPSLRPGICARLSAIDARSGFTIRALLLCAVSCTPTACYRGGEHRHMSTFPATGAAQSALIQLQAQDAALL